MAFSPNGRFALIGTDSTVTIFDLLDIKQIKGYQSQVQTGWVTAVAFSHDSNFALTGSSDETAQLWDLTAFPTMRSYPLQGHTGWVTAATFSPDGQHALTGSSDKTARLWDLSEFPITSRELTGHTGALRSVAFDPTGRYALTGSTDQTARLWDITQSAITKLGTGEDIPTGSIRSLLAIMVNTLSPVHMIKRFFCGILHNIRSQARA